MRRFVDRLPLALRGDEGATMVEYALMIVLIAVVAVGAIAVLGGNVSTAFSNPALGSAL
jgi:pilus assembly protein Flp/PilA